MQGQSSVYICDLLNENPAHCVQFMKNEITQQIGIPMFNCAAEKDGSDQLLGSQATERNEQWMRNELFEKT